MLLVNFSTTEDISWIFFVLDLCNSSNDCSSSKHGVNDFTQLKDCSPLEYVCSSF